MLIKQCFSQSTKAFKIKPEVACYLATWLVAMATALLTEITLGILFTMVKLEPSARMVLGIDYPNSSLSI